MTGKKAHLLVLGLVALSFALPAWFYARLPDPMPTHWGLDGTADGWTPKPLGPFLLPLIQLAVWGLLAAVPAISPRGYRIERFGAAYSRILVLTMAFLTVIGGLVVARALSAPVDMTRVVTAAVGLLFAGIGNYLGKTTPNFFVGVRTPWTIASPEVWTRTHRFAGWLFVLCGLAAALWALVGPAPLWSLAALVPPAIVPIVYSYVLYRRVEPRDGGEPPEA